MKVVCKINNIFDINDGETLERIKKYILLTDGQLNLEKNNEYCVYGVIFRDNSPWYYICLDEDDESPTPYPAELFKVTDDKFSSYWRLTTENTKFGVVSSLVFEEWANDPLYFENLVDDDFEAVGLFSKYRKLMNEE